MRSERTRTTRDAATRAAGALTDAALPRIARREHDAVRPADGRVLVLGGADARDDRGTYRSAALRDPACDRWTATGDPVAPHYKRAGTSLLLADGSDLVASAAGVVERYDASRGTFSLVLRASAVAAPRGSSPPWRR